MIFSCTERDAILRRTHWYFFCDNQKFRIKIHLDKRSILQSTSPVVDGNDTQPCRLLTRKARNSGLLGISPWLAGWSSSFSLPLLSWLFASSKSFESWVRAECEMPNYLYFSTQMYSVFALQSKASPGNKTTAETAVQDPSMAGDYSNFIWINREMSRQ